MSDEEVRPPIYVNVVQVTAGPFDIVLDFGFKGPEAQRGETEAIDWLARIAMSPGHAKTMIPILARVIAEYEKQVGPVPAPGFDDIAKG